LDRSILVYKNTFTCVNIFVFVLNIYSNKEKKIITDYLGLSLVEETTAEAVTLNTVRSKIKKKIERAGLIRFSWQHVKI
jgi:hypothetical protein